MTPSDLPLDGRLTLTRRRLVVAGGAGAAALYLGALPAAAPAATAPAYLRRASYAGLVASRFKALTATGARVRLTLTSVEDLVRAGTEPGLRGRDDAFTLMFDGPSTPVVTAGVRRINHPTLGWVSLFVAPVGRASGSQAYEVVVDRRPL